MGDYLEAETFKDHRLIKDKNKNEQPAFITIYTMNFKAAAFFSGLNIVQLPEKTKTVDSVLSQLTIYPNVILSKFFSLALC